MLHPVVCLDSGIAESQSYSELVFQFVASAAGTEHVLVGGQKSAAKRVFCVSGNGSVDISSARAEDLVKGHNNEALSAEQLLMKAQIVSYLTNIPAAADGAVNIAVAIGGISVSQFLSAELEVSSIGTSAANTVRSSRQVNLAQVYAPSDTAPVFGTNPVAILLPNEAAPSVLALGISIADIADVAGAGELLTLRILCK